MSITKIGQLQLCREANCFYCKNQMKTHTHTHIYIYEGWNFNSGNYLFTTDTK